MSKTYKKSRDFNVKKAYEKEVNISTKVHKPKSAYQRKPKYTPTYEEE